MDFVCRTYDDCDAVYDGDAREFRGPGKIDGKHSLAGQYVGYWVQNTSSRNCAEERLGSYNWGRVDFRFSRDADSFDGFWSYCDDEPGFENRWHGIRE
jgi:hypothetical protein